MKPASSNMSDLVIPGALLRQKNPFGSALSKSLGRLQAALEPEDGVVYNDVPVVWAFREVVDFVTVFLASAAIAPLSASDAPLPGWRRSLWRSDFGDVASGLLSWAVAYLPRRSRQNVLAASLLKLLFSDGENHIMSEPRSFVGLLGVGSTTTQGAGSWLQWRDKFFGCRDIDKMVEFSSGILDYISELNALLEAFNEFLISWNIETAFRGDSVRLVLRGEARHELPPFLVVQDCPQCGAMGALFAFVAPQLGDTCLYREADTGHLAVVDVDMSFKRRFFTNSPSMDSGSLALRNSAGSSMSSSSDTRAAVDAELVTESISEVKQRLLSSLTEDIYLRYHVPVLAAVSQCREPMPLAILGDPSLGCRDGVGASYRLNGFVGFGDDGTVELRGPQVLDSTSAAYVDQMQAASSQLGRWALARVRYDDPSLGYLEFAMRGLARWALGGHDKELIDTLSGDDSPIDTIYNWLQELITRDSGWRDVVLNVSADWMTLLEQASEPSPDRIVSLRIFRAQVYREAFDYAQAREELDKALVYAQHDEGSGQLLRARVLKERARINLDLEKPAQAVEDGMVSAQVWNRLASSGSVDALSALAEVTSLHAKALLALGHRAQAISVMQKVAEKAVTPRSSDEAMIWVGLNLELAEILRVQGGNAKIQKARFQDVLKYLDGLEETSRTREAKARALRGLVDDKDIDSAIADLKVSEGLLEELVAHGREDLKPVLAEVENLVSDYLERAGRLDEAIEMSAVASELYQYLVTNYSLPAYRLALAGLWTQRARLNGASENVDVAEDALNRALSLYAGLVEDGQSKLSPVYGEVLAQRGVLRAKKGNLEQAKEDLEMALEKWPDLDDPAVSSSSLVNLYHVLGQVDAGLGLSKAAIEAYDRAAECAEARGDRVIKRQLVSERVWLLFNAGYSQRAADDFGVLLQRTVSKTDGLRLTIARGVARLRAMAYAEALEDFQTAVQLSADSLEAVAGCGLALLGLQDPAQAVQSFKSLLDVTKAAHNASGVRTLVSIAHGGLAGVHTLLNAPWEIREEYELALRAWCDGSENTDENPLLTEVGFFTWELAQVLISAGQLAVEHGSYERAQHGLSDALVLLERPGQADEVENARHKALGWRARAWAGLKMDKVALPEATVLLDKWVEPGEENEPLLVWLLLYCARLSIDPLVKVGCLDKAVALLHKAALLDNERNTRTLAVAYLLRGFARAQTGELSDGLDDDDQAIRLLQELRTRSEGRGLEWELCLALLIRAVAFHYSSSAASSVYDLQEVLAVLADASQPEPDNEWLRAQFVELFVSYITMGVQASAGLCAAIGEIVGLEVWTKDESRLFEDKISDGLGGDMPDNAWPSVGIAARQLASRPVDDNELVGGRKIIETWLQRGIFLAQQGGINCTACLEALSALYDQVQHSVAWPSDYGWKAKRMLARCALSEGEKQRALGLLLEAREAIDADGRASSIFSEVDLDLERAQIFCTMSQYKDCSVAIGRAEVALESTLPENLGSDEQTERGQLSERVTRLRELLAESGWVDESKPEPVSEVIGQASLASGLAVDSAHSVEQGEASGEPGIVLELKRSEVVPSEEPLTIETSAQLEFAPSVKAVEAATDTAASLSEGEPEPNWNTSAEVAAALLGSAPSGVGVPSFPLVGSLSEAFNPEDFVPVEELPQDEGVSSQLSSSQPEAADSLGSLLEQGSEQDLASTDEALKDAVAADSDAEIASIAGVSDSIGAAPNSQLTDSAEGAESAVVSEPLTSEDAPVKPLAQHESDSWPDDSAEVESSQVESSELGEGQHSSEPVLESQEPTAVGRGARWSVDKALDSVDEGFAAMDQGIIEEAYAIFADVGEDLVHAGDARVLEVIPALLEGLLETAREFDKNGLRELAADAAEYGAELAARYLADDYSDEAWAWWGDLDALAGKLAYQVHDYDKACTYFRRGQDTFLNMLARGPGEEARLDALRLMGLCAGALQDANKLTEAEREYSLAVEHGEKVVAAGYHQEAWVAGLHMALGRVRIALRMYDAAAMEYERAVVFYNRAAEHDGSDHIVEIAMARAGLAEVHIRVGRLDDAQRILERLDDARVDLEVKKRYTESGELAGLYKRVDDLFRRFAG